MSAKPYSTFNRTLQNSIVPTTLSLSFRNRKRKWAPNPTAHSITLFKTPLSLVPTALSLSLVLCLCLRLVLSSCLCSCSWLIYANVPCNGLQIGGGESRALRVSVLARDRSMPMSRATDSKSEEENHGQSNHEEEHQCLMQRTPNRTTKHIQKIIYEEIWGESRAFCVSVLARDRSTPMSRATDSKSEEENHGQSNSEEERQCLVQRTPNRTAKHIQKIIYGKICSSSEEEAQVSAKPYNTFNRTLQNSIVPTDLSLSLVLCLCMRLALSSCLCSCSWSIYANVPCNGFQIEGESWALRVSVLGLDWSTPMSHATDSKSEEENHGQSSSEEERQCLVQRTPNRTAKHIQKIIYGEICNSSEEEEEENHRQCLEKISRHCPHRRTDTVAIIYKMFQHDMNCMNCEKNV